MQHLDLSTLGTPVQHSTAPFLATAAELQHLKVAHGTLKVATLHPLTQLQQLDLNHMTLLPDAAAALALLSTLQHLHHLRLGFLTCPWPPVSAAYHIHSYHSSQHTLSLGDQRVCVSCRHLAAYLPSTAAAP
jgi:hypothetical protein